jgi:hypothetical protein
MAGSFSMREECRLPAPYSVARVTKAEPILAKQNSGRVGLGLPSSRLKALTMMRSDEPHPHRGRVRRFASWQLSTPDTLPCRAPKHTGRPSRPVLRVASATEHLTSRVRLKDLLATIRISHALAMFVVSEAQAAAIRAIFHQRGEFSAAVELRRLFPGIASTERAREYARTIAGWAPLPTRLRPARLRPPKVS